MAVEQAPGAVTMFPTGSRVTVRSVQHLARPGKHQHLIGRTGVIVDHENGMNIVAGLTWHDRLSGLHAFADDDLEATGQADPPRLPPTYFVSGYHAPERR